MHSCWKWVAGCSLLALGGCATTSFAPPAVELKSHPQPTIDHAIRDVDDFIRAYRVAAHSAANGRTGFEVPAFLTSLGALTASAFGAGKDVAIAAGAAGTALTGGNSYFAPKSKAAILRRGVEAFECIQQVATGVKPFGHSATAGISNFSEAVNGNQANQFYLVRNATVSVDTIVADRLAESGSLAAAQALAADYEKLVQQRIADREKAGAANIAKSAMFTTDAEKVATMQTDLQLCVLRARN